MADPVEMHPGDVMGNFAFRYSWVLIACGALAAPGWAVADCSKSNGVVTCYARNLNSAKSEAAQLCGPYVGWTVTNIPYNEPSNFVGYSCNASTNTSAQATSQTTGAPQSTVNTAQTAAQITAQTSASAPTSASPSFDTPSAPSKTNPGSCTQGAPGCPGPFSPTSNLGAGSGSGGLNLSFTPSAPGTVQTGADGSSATVTDSGGTYQVPIPNGGRVQPNGFGSSSILDSQGDQVAYIDGSGGCYGSGCPTSAPPVSNIDAAQQQANTYKNGDMASLGFGSTGSEGTGTSVQPSVQNPVNLANYNAAAAPNAGAAPAAPKETTFPTDGSVPYSSVTKNSSGQYCDSSNQCYSLTPWQQAHWRAANRNPDGGPGSAEDQSHAIKGASDDPCSVAMQIADHGGNGQKYACAGTKSLMQTSQITSVVGQMGGSMAIGMMGQAQTANLVQTGVTQSSAMETAAGLQEKAGLLQTALGAVQLGMGYEENKQGNQHAEQAKNFKAASDAATYSPEQRVVQLQGYAATPGQVTVAGTTDSSGLANAALAAAGAPVGGQTNVATLEGAVQHAQQGGADAQEQLQSMASKAQSAGLGDMVRGGGTAFMGIMAIMGAKQEENAAHALNGAANGVVPTGADPFTPVSNSGSGVTAISGNGLNPNPVASVASNGAGALPSVAGGGLPGGPPGSGVAQPGPAPGAFVPSNGNNNGAGAMGGGDMGLSGGTPPAPSTDGQTPQAQYANGALGGSVGYSGTGAPGGSRGGGGGAGNPALSLRDAFAQLMGGGQRNAGGGSNIEAYRGIASDANAMLAQQDNFFQMIHSAYENLQRRGQVGK